MPAPELFWACGHFPLRGKTYSAHRNAAVRGISRVTDARYLGGNCWGWIAGAWTALRLAQRGIPAVFITYQSSDRGGVQGATVRSVGAINTSPTDQPDFHENIISMCHGQSNDSIGRLMHERLAGEVTDLIKFSELESIKIGLRLSKGSKYLLETLYRCR
jgi:hypothetical protein